MVSSGEDQLLLFISEKNSGLFLFPREYFQNWFLSVCWSGSLLIIYKSARFNTPNPILMSSMAVQNKRTEVSRGLIEIRPLCLDGFFWSSEEECCF